MIKKRLPKKGDFDLSAKPNDMVGTRNSKKNAESIQKAQEEKELRDFVNNF